MYSFLKLLFAVSLIMLSQFDAERGPWLLRGMLLVLGVMLLIEVREVLLAEK